MGLLLTVARFPNLNPHCKKYICLATCHFPPQITVTLPRHPEKRRAEINHFRLVEKREHARSVTVQNGNTHSTKSATTNTHKSNPI